jgi:hypothetical protein
MRNIMRILQVVAAFFLFSAVVTAQADWKGSYSFTENGGRNAGGSTIVITHELDIYDGGDGLTATLRSNGYQTSSNFICTAKIEGAKLLIYFQSYGEDNMFELYEAGDLLLTLERKGKTRPVILTYWGKFTPNVTKYAKSGKVYFEKTTETRYED